MKVPTQGRHTRPSFLSLLVLGLKHFEGTEFPKPLISKYLLPCKTAHQLTVRIKNRSMHRAPDNIFKVSAPHPARELRALRIPVPPTRGPPSSRLPGGAGLPSSSAASAAAVVGGLPAAWEMTPSSVPLATRLSRAGRETAHTCGFVLNSPRVEIYVRTTG